jgi:hypothetical protein
MKPGLLSLYKEAVAAGKKPEDVGLPAISLGNIAVFEASLISPDGKVVQTAHALYEIRTHKDLEICETSARQRLVAACGYAGELLDDNERQDMLRQGVGDSAVPAPESRKTSVQAPVPPARPDPSTATAPVASKAPVAAEKSAKSSPVASKRDDASSRPVGRTKQDRTAAALAGLRNQIAGQARSLGIEAPQVADLDEARKVLRQLIQQGRKRPG